MNKVHEIFPLVVYQDSIDCHKEFKKENLNLLKEYWFNGYENESPEYSGRIFLHNDPQYNIFFDDLKRSIDNYFYHLNVDYSKLNYHVTKSWVGYHTKEIPELNPHYHNESNISFVYYLQSSKDSDKFCVSQNNNINENTGGLFEPSNQRNTLLTYNKYNCNYYTITPHEGTVLLFPSNVIHHTIKGDGEDERIVIAGDIRITLKEECNNHHQASTHPNQWKQI
jgi:uncharacterized protein (TIGR02466 family)